MIKLITIGTLRAIRWTLSQEMFLSTATTVKRPAILIS